MITSCKPVLTILSARIFLKEAFGAIEVLATVLMMAGVVLVIKPAFIFGTVESDVGEDDQYLVSALLLLGSTFLTANISIILKYLRKESLLSILITREIVFSVITFVVISVFGLPLFLLEPMERLEVLLMSGICLLTSALNIAALRVEEANKVTVIDRSSSIIVSYIVQIIVTDDVPGMYTSIGVVLVLLAIIIIGANKIFCNNKKNDPRPVLEKEAKQRGTPS